MTAENHLDELETCLNDDTLIAYEINKGIEDLKKGGIENYLLAAFEFVLVYEQFGDALKDCENMQDDLAAIEEWAKIFLKPKELCDELSYNLLKNKEETIKDVHKTMADWEVKNYFNTGVDISTLMMLGLGPIKESYLLMKYGNAEEKLAVQKYLAYLQF